MLVCQMCGEAFEPDYFDDLIPLCPMCKEEINQEEEIADMPQEGDD